MGKVKKIVFELEDGSVLELTLENIQELYDLFKPFVENKGEKKERIREIILPDIKPHRDPKPYEPSYPYPTNPEFPQPWKDWEITFNQPLSGVPNNFGLEDIKKFIEREDKDTRDVRSF